MRPGRWRPSASSRVGRNELKDSEENLKQLQNMINEHLSPWGTLETTGASELILNQMRHEHERENMKCREMSEKIQQLEKESSGFFSKNPNKAKIKELKEEHKKCQERVQLDFDE